MNLQLTAKVIQVLPEQGGTSARGNAWSKQEFIVETQEDYPKKVCLSTWGDKVDRRHLQEGNVLTISFNVESREFNGRWYTELRVWRLEMAGNTSAPRTERPAAPPSNAAPEPDPFVSESADDELPF